MNTVASGQDSPSARDRRTSPRRPEELGPRAPALRDVHRERGLACPGGHGVEPHPRRRHSHRADAGQVDHAHHRGPRTPGILRPTDQAAPSGRAAMPDRVDTTAHDRARLRTPTSGNDLTTQPQRHDLEFRTWTPGNQARRESPCPTTTQPPKPTPKRPPRNSSVDPGLCPDPAAVTAVDSDQREEWLLRRSAPDDLVLAVGCHIVAARSLSTSAAGADEDPDRRSRQSPTFR
jgi:hypothetical protein